MSEKERIKIAGAILGAIAGSHPVVQSNRKLGIVHKREMVQDALELTDLLIEKARES